MPSQINKFQEALINISRVRKETDTAVLLYSAGGKDSIALLDMLAKRFNKVVCYYLYHVQGLDHIKPYILWAEKRYGNVVVKQLPHNQVNSFLKFGIWCDPVLETKEMNERDIVEYIKKV